VVAVPAVFCRFCSSLNNVSVNCVICISTHILRIVVTDSIVHVFVHFSSDENSQKNVANELLFKAQTCTKSFVGWGFAPDPTEGAHSAPPDL